MNSVQVDRGELVINVIYSHHSVSCKFYHAKIESEFTNTFTHKVADKFLDYQIIKQDTLLTIRLPVEHFDKLSVEGREAKKEKKMSTDKTETIDRRGEGKWGTKRKDLPQSRKQSCLLFHALLKGVFFIFSQFTIL